MSTVDLYNVLGVARDATTDEISTAWTAAVSGLVPTDPSFRVFNQAGEILLDPSRRAKYDADLAAADVAATVAPTETAATVAPTETTVTTPTGTASDLTASRRIDGLLATLLALTLIVGGAAAFFADDLGRALPDRSAPAGVAGLADAVSAAESAVVPVLSYDYKHLDENRTAALSWMTHDFADDYRKTFALIEQNAAEAQAVVKVEVLGSAVAAARGNKVDVLLFVNRPTTNKARPEATIYRDQVTLVMVRSGSKWLVEDLRTTLPS